MSRRGAGLAEKGSLKTGTGSFPCCWDGTQVIVQQGIPSEWGAGHRQTRRLRRADRPADGRNAATNPPGAFQHALPPLGSAPPQGLQNPPPEGFVSEAGAPFPRGPWARTCGTTHYRSLAISSLALATSSSFVWAWPKVPNLPERLRSRRPRSAAWDRDHLPQWRRDYAYELIAATEGAVVVARACKSLLPLEAVARRLLETLPTAESTTAP